MRAKQGLWVFAGLIALTVGLASVRWHAWAADYGAGQGVSGVSEPSSGQAEAALDRLREGTVLMEQSGRFQQTGDRLVFYAADGKRRLGALENLNLERIAKLVSENPEPLEWTVSGTVTEFQGTNYLFVDRAVLKTRLNRRSQPIK